MSQLSKTNIYIFFLTNPTPLDPLIRLYLVTFTCFFFIGQQQALASHWLQKVANSTPPLLIIGISNTTAATNQLLS
jgi:hypothetical protein